MGISFFLVSGLVLTLFDEARAVEMRFTEDVPKLLSGIGVFDLEIILPDGERVPIESITTVIEKQAAGASGKEGATLVTRATCDFTGNPASGCAQARLSIGEGQPAAISSIFFAGYYDKGGSPVPVTEAYGYGAILGTTTGYGYDSAGVFGYGYATGGKVSFNGGYGYGYGTPGEDLVLRFRITIASATLDVGTHYLTVLAETGSDIIGTLSSPYAEFGVHRPASAPLDRTMGGGGGGSGTGDGGGRGPGPGPTPGPEVTVPMAPVAPPPAARASFESKPVTATAQQTVKIETTDALVKTIKFKPSEDLKDAVITVTVFAPMSPPPELASAPPTAQSLAVSGYVRISISSGGTEHVVTIAVTMPEAEAGDPERAVLVKWDEAAFRWVPQDRITLTLEGGVFSGAGESSCCSLFGVFFDETAPSVGITLPTEPIRGVHEFIAVAEDDLMVARLEFYVRDQLMFTDFDAPYVWSHNVSDMQDSEYQLVVIAYDYVDNVESAGGTFTVQDDVKTQVRPGTAEEPPSMIRLAGNIFFIFVGIGLVGYGAYWLNKRKTKKQ